jgi:SAM-dependent methyltransferase
MDTVTERVNQLAAEGVFLGGPARVFGTAGRTLLMTLLKEGATPDSRVLDIGCGCLRGGYWLIHFLDESRYFGIEPNVKMLEAGLRILLEPGLANLKKPAFAHNADFDFTAFGETFDFFVARSIWTHASKPQIQIMLDGFVKTARGGATFLTSYRPSTLFGHDYAGEGWVGRSHHSDTPGMVRHSLGWIRSECAQRGLRAEEIKDKAFNFGDQTWLRIRHASSNGRI